MIEAQKPKPVVQEAPRPKKQEKSFLHFLSFVPKLRLVTFLLMAVFLYLIPVGFAGWLNGESDLIFTSVQEREFWPLNYFTTTFEHAEMLHTFIPFRLTYIGCLTLNGALVSLILEIVK
jgi:hypothetical protein